MSAAPGADTNADLSQQPIVWRPDNAALERSRVLAFGRAHGLNSWEALVERAGDDPGWFWNAVSEELGLVWSSPYTTVLDTSQGIQWPQWFVGGRMNWTVSAVDRWLDSRADDPALSWEGDDGTTCSLTMRELHEQIGRAANAMLALGIGKGDRVGIFLPMLVETAVAVLACGRIGAIFVPIFSGYGAEAVATRLQDADASLLITADGFKRRGNAIPMKATADAALERSPSVKHVLVVQRVGTDVSWTDGRDHWWHDALEQADADCPAADTAGNDPFMLIYTSGTTGRPKGAVHIHAGFPVKAAQDLALAFDLRVGETLCWLTDLGWMMGPWAIMGTLIAGGHLLLFEGTPDYPQPDRLWELVERHNVNVFGISPTAMRSLMAQGEKWPARHPMPSLRALGSTGEPWNPAPWRWTFEHVGKGRCPIVNYSGGTEISGGIIVASTIQPQKPCAFTGPVPGMLADVVDPEGNPVRGSVGELVIRGPWVGMTNGFWNDRERYLESYWSRVPDLWFHGDWAMIDDDGFWYILGRSDDTLKIAGKRVGPAEIESAAVQHPAVQEAAAIGVPHDVKGEGIVVFAVLRPGTQADETLPSAISATIVEQLGRPLKPEHVYVVSDLPRTRSAKIMRRVIRAAYLGTDAGDLSSLENPNAVTAIENTR